MGAELVRDFPAARLVFEEADEALGIRLSRICFEGRKRICGLPPTRSRRR